MASLTKTASGRWRAVVRRRGWPSSTKTFRLKRDARMWARHVEDQIDRSVLPLRVTPLPFPDALARYLETVTPRKSRNTQAKEKGRARTLLGFFRGYSLTAITPELVARYRDLRLVTKRRHPRFVATTENIPLAPATVRLELAMLSHIFIVAIREWRVGLVQNPVSLVQRPSPSRCRTRRLGVEEERRLFAVARRYCNPMVERIIRIALETGMRQTEILHLRMEDVDLQHRVVHLVATKNGDARTVPLSRLAARVLKVALADKARPAGNPFLFYGDATIQGTTTRAVYSFRTAWHAVRDAADLHDFRFHDLRHEAISRMVEGGLGDQEVAAISGHRSMQMLRRYTHLRAEDLVQKLDAMRRPRRVR